MNRRFLLTAVPLAAVSLPASVQLPSPSPIMALFRKWETLRDMADAHDTPEPIADAYCAEMVQIEDQMLALPSRDAADFAAKIVAYTSFGACILTEDCAPEIWNEARRLLSA